MTDKTKEAPARSALKLALEALKRMKHYGNTFAYRNYEQNPYEQVCEAIAAIEALAEQPAQSQLTELEKDAANLLFALYDAWPYVHGWCTIERHKQNIIHLMRKHGDFADLYAVQPQQEFRDNWKDRLIAQHEETILWQAKRIGELTDQTAQPQQEPVAFDVVCHDCGGDGFDQQDSNYRCALCNGCGFIEKMLYTSPPSLSPAQRKPLTDGQISWLWSDAHNDTTDLMPFQVFARAIEAAHGIKGETK